jgi:putative ABC transport system permease protein
MTTHLVDDLQRDSRVALRAFRQTPLFTTAAIVALALGIGATTAMLSVVNGVLLRPLPYADADRLAVILHDGRNPVSPGNYVDWRREMRAFTDVAAAEYWTPTLAARDEPEEVYGLHVTANLFPLLGVRPLLGRLFAEHEDEPGNEQVAIIGYGLWQRVFGGDRGIVGRRISLDGNVVTVIGVMPRTFQFAPFWATHAELWAPLVLAPRLGTTNRGGQSLRLFARLRPGVSLDQARLDVAAVTARLERAYPGTNRNVAVVPLKDKVVGDIRTPLVVLLVGVAFVLLIACANVAHMLLARAVARQKELAIRTALGATRGRLVAQLLVESVLLAAFGGCAGLLLAFWGVRSLVAASPAIIPRIASVAIDARVLLMSVGLTAATAIAFGLVPSFRAARVDLVESFKAANRNTSGGHSGTRLRDALVASEFALALVLLVGAGLMIRTFVALRHIDPGFDARNVVAMNISTIGTREADTTVHAAFYADALERVRALPGVESASFINHLPIAGDIWGFPFSVEGRPKPRPGEAPTATYRVVFPGYFHTMRIPLLRGRDIDDADRLGAPNVVIVNEYMAARHWPGDNPIGKRISLDDSTWTTVVGIAKNDIRHDWAAPPEEEMFLPFFQQRGYLKGSGPSGSMTLVARLACDRSACDAASLAPPIARAVRGLDRKIPISQVETMSSVVADATAESRFYLVLLAAFAIVAVALAAVGIYGVMSYAVSRRTREIGIRIALGATPSTVLRIVIGHGMLVVGLGAAAGTALALVLTRLMSRLLYGVSAGDPVTFVTVTTLLSAVALAASAAPARRATRVDAVRALRSD